MNSRDQSDAIWISRRSPESKYVAQGGIGSKSFSAGGFRGQSSFDFGTSNINNINSSSPNPRLGFGRSMSVNSEGASTASSSNSPPYSPIDIGSRKGAFDGGVHPGGGGGGGRFRTSSFSAGYGPSYGAADNSYDPYLIHSPLSTSAPGKHNDQRTFRRSNSISVGALEHSHHNSGGMNNSAHKKSLGQPPLGPIDEYTKMASFGDVFKRSMDHLFSSPKIQAVGGRFGGSGAGAGLGNGSGSPKLAAMSSIKEKKQMKDQVVSMLCESAIR